MTVTAPPDTLTARDIFEHWLQGFGEALTGPNPADAARFIADDGYWKDALAFTWSLRMFDGRSGIEQAMRDLVGAMSPRDVRLSPLHDAPSLLTLPGPQIIEGFFDFETTVGTCTGIARLPYDEHSPLPVTAEVVLTTLRSLHEVEEPIGEHRPSGLDYSYTFAGDNWLDKRNHDREYHDRQPQVVVVGAGQSGLSLAAVCQQQGLDTLVVEKHPRVGDNWRTRYHALALHNEIFANDLPYMPFPPTWPKFIPKDKLAAWLESYAEAMELNVWTSTEIVSGTYDDSAQSWELIVRRAGGSERTVRPAHVVMAGGSVSSAPNTVELPGLGDFQGAVMYAEEFDDGRAHSGRQALVVGTGTSGHDVAQSLHCNGASVTMMQRSPTYVISLVPGAVTYYLPYAQGRPLADVDLSAASLTYPQLIEHAQTFTGFANQMDKELLDGLHAAGFETDDGEDHTGMLGKYLRRGGGYYINVGCSELIADHSISLVQARDMGRFVADGLQMSDGTVIPLDLVVLATGYRNQQEAVRRIFGDEVADRVGPIWGFDRHRELAAMWKQTGQPGFWVTGGNLLDCRLKSRWLALQIKAATLGVLPRVIEA